jgi:hypothetical protein
MTAPVVRRIFLVLASCVAVQGVKNFTDFHVTYYSSACFTLSNEISNDIKSSQPTLYPNILVVNQSASTGKKVLREDVLSFAVQRPLRSLSVVPILTEGMLRHKGRGASHIYHSWESFWPAVKLYQLLHAHVKYMVLPDDYVTNSFVSVAVSQLVKEALSFYVIESNSQMCVDELLVVENSAWLKDDLALLARRVYTEACELHVSTLRNAELPLADVLLSRRSVFGRTKFIANMVDLKDELQRRNISFEYFSPHAEASYCDTLRHVSRPHQVHIAVSGDNLCNFIVADLSSTIIEVLTRGLFGTMYCELQKSLGIRLYGFMQKSLSFQDEYDAADRLPRNTEKPVGSSFRSFCSHRTHTIDPCILPQWCNMSELETGHTNVMFLSQSEVTRLATGISNITRGLSVRVDSTVPPDNLTWFEPSFEHAFPEDFGEKV